MPEGDAILPSGDETLWFLTGNTDKFREASSILAPFGIKIRRLKRSKTEIQDPRLENIARFGLREALEDHRGPILVEDSGIFIRSLGWFPGPYSSFVYGTIGLRGILDLLRGRSDRRAYFQCTVAFGSSAANIRLFTGRVGGMISPRIAGKEGFGYDPIFVPDGSKKTFGQTSPAFKNTHSHRARAFEKFARWYVS